MGDERTLTLRFDVDEIAKYASIIGLASAVLAGAGILSTIAYLMAWNVPAPLVRLDPLTAALRSDTVLYQVAVLATLVYGLESIARRIRRRRAQVAAGIVATLAIGFLVVDTITGGFVGPVVTVVGGVSLFAAHRRRWLGARARLVLFAAVALLAAFQTGYESGRLIRDDARFQTPIVLTSRTAVGGLDGGVEVSGAWQYIDLYLVFRDGEAVYVSRPEAGATVWIVPAMHIMSLGVGAS
ncbi:MAG TPA: hypothetical protein VFR14_14380 [Candidatus Limnocylindrales bacterium]|nr:hypothetical protein [Candidatus Limnocylindrales bacterium]